MRHSTVPHDIAALSQSRAQAFQAISAKEAPPLREAGQIWSTLSTMELVDGRSFQTEEPRLVVILDLVGEYTDPFRQVSVAPISLRTEMACQWDLLISKDLSPGGFEFMVEVWNETPALVGQLNRYLGNLPEAAHKVLARLSEALQEDESPIGVEGWVGLPLMGEQDPRVVFQSAELEAVAYLANAATAALDFTLAKNLAEELAQSAEPAGAAKGLHSARVFDLRPLFGRLSEYLHQSQKRSVVAHAASGVKEENTYIIHGSDPEGGLYFTFELLNRRRSPYPVYVEVHDLSQVLEGSICILTLTTYATELRSDPTVLHIDTSVLIGYYPDFRAADIQTVRVEIK